MKRKRENGNATKVPERRPNRKNYQTSLTNDEPTCKQLGTLESNYEYNKSETDFSSSEDENERIVTQEAMKNVNHRQENLTNDDSHVSEEEEPVQTSFNQNIVESKELLQFRPDNVTYFVASNGDPCDKGYRTLIEANKIPAKQALQIGSVNETKRINNK